MTEDQKSLSPQDDKYRWKGEEPEPYKWFAEDGTLVYRSYEDYCMD